MNELKHLNRDYSSLRNTGTGLVGDRILNDFIDNSNLTKDSNDSYESKLDTILNLFEQNNINVGVDGDINSSITQTQFDNYVSLRKSGVSPDTAINQLK